MRAWKNEVYGSFKVLRTRWCNPAFLLIHVIFEAWKFISFLDKGICDSKVECHLSGRDSDVRVYSLSSFLPFSLSLSLSLSFFLCFSSYYLPLLDNVCTRYRAYRDTCTRYTHDWSNKNRIYVASTAACENASCN